jgi:hypothetical protein
MDEPRPERPRDVGVEEDAPDSLSALEGARVLANEARERLRADGFSDTDIDRWADAFLAEKGTGEVDDLVEWIKRREQS